MNAMYNFDPLNCLNLYNVETPKTTNYTIQPNDNGHLFTNEGAAGAIVFTLPPLGTLYFFGFVVRADQTVTIQSSEGTNLVTFNNAAASSIAFSTANEKVGAMVELFTNQARTKWYMRKMCQHTLTVA